MRLKRVFSVFLTFLLFASLFPISFVYAVEDSASSGDSGDSGSGGGTTINYNYYYNYYYLNDTEFDYVDLYSLNNRDESSYWRPKYEEVSTPLKEYVEFNDKSIKMNKNGFDVEWSEIDKSKLPTSRALELLGYDLLLNQEIVDKSSGEVKRIQANKSNITSTQFVMDFYKAIGINLYDIYYRFEYGTANCGVYVTRTNPQSYWNLFINDHPINYGIYTDTNVTDATIGQSLTVADGITILAQMLDFYGEPVISDYEEYLLLQVYGNDVPVGLTEIQKDAWSYLKCRGIIGEDEYNYTSNLTFDVLMELLMRAADKDSRTNFKDVQITTSLDNSLIKNGYFQADTSVEIRPELTPISSSVSYADAKRYDYLIEMNDDMRFTFSETGEVNDNLFISFGPEHTDKAIPGSVFEGIVDNKYYHFTVPISEISVISGKFISLKHKTIYLNSTKGGDLPLNYTLPASYGGVYSIPESYDKTASITYSKASTFNNALPESTYVDEDRRVNGMKKNEARAASTGATVTYTYSTEMIDVDATKSRISSIKGAKCTNTKDTITITLPNNNPALNTGKFDTNNIINSYIVLKAKYTYNKNNTSAIMNLYGDGVFIELKDAEDIGLVVGHTLKLEDDVLFLYLCDKSIVVIDNKSRTIQKGSHYMQFGSIKDDDATPLFTASSINSGSFCVDFRALYGSANGFFSITNGVDGKKVVQLYDNRLQYNKNSSSTSQTDTVYGKQVVVGTGSNAVIYNWGSTAQMSATSTTNTERLDNSFVNLLYKFNKANSKDLSKDIDSVYLPMSSNNPYGNYLLYTDVDVKTGVQKDYLVVFSQNKVFTSFRSDRDYKTMFGYYPSYVDGENSAYNVSVIELSATNTYGMTKIAGVGWCYKMPKLSTNDINMKKSLLSNYRTHKANSVLPYAWFADARTCSAVNFNLNYLSEDSYANLELPGSTDMNSYFNNVVTAPVGVQSWITNPEFVPTFKCSSVMNNANNYKLPVILWGSMNVDVSSTGKTSSKSVTTKVGGLNLKPYFDKEDNVLYGVFSISSVLGNVSYDSPDIYFFNPTPLSVTLSTEKESADELEIVKMSADLQAFFDKYKDITFMDFIRGLDNGMSVLYYIITRVVPLIILCLLVLILMISMVADIKIVQLFCTKVFDPVKILTFGTHNIETVRNGHLLVSLIGALFLMGMIQAGNLEKIIMFFVRAYYAVTLFFK